MLSIIVPIYNVEKYLEECINSILNQTYREIEVLLIDDGSTDCSWEICCKFQEKDTRVKAIHKENSGVSATRNCGLDYANGEFISFCDSDDVIKPQLYEVLFEKMRIYDADRVCGGYEYLYPDGHTLYKKPRKLDRLYERDVLLSMMIDDGTMSGFLFSGVCNSIFKKSIIDKYHIRFDEKLRYNEDSLFSFEYALHSRNIFSYQSVPLYFYRQHNLSATKKRTVGDKYILLRQKLSTIDLDKTKINFDLQMQRRMVTETFWQILDISDKENGRNAINAIKKELCKEELTKNIDIINPNELNKYKRVFYYMMKYKSAYSIYFFCKVLVPILSKYLSR